MTVSIVTIIIIVFGCLLQYYNSNFYFFIFFDTLVLFIQLLYSDFVILQYFLLVILHTFITYTYIIYNNNVNYLFFRDFVYEHYFNLKNSFLRNHAFIIYQNFTHSYSVT